MVERKPRRQFRYVPAAQSAVTTVPATRGNTGKTLVFSYDALSRLASASTTAASSSPFRRTFEYTAIRQHCLDPPSSAATRTLDDDTWNLTSGSGRWWNCATRPRAQGWRGALGRDAQASSIPYNLLTQVNAPISATPYALCVLATSSASSLCALDLTRSIIALVARPRIDRRLGTKPPSSSRRQSLALALGSAAAVMQGTSLAGGSVLIVEDEPLLRSNLSQRLSRPVPSSWRRALWAMRPPLVEHDGLSAAVLDLGFGDNDAGALCVRLEHWNSGVSSSSCTVDTAITRRPD